MVTETEVREIMGIYNKNMGKNIFLTCEETQLAEIEELKRQLDVTSQRLKDEETRSYVLGQEVHELKHTNVH